MVLENATRPRRTDLIRLIEALAPHADRHRSRALARRCAPTERRWFATLARRACPDHFAAARAFAGFSVPKATPTPAGAGRRALRFWCSITA